MGFLYELTGYHNPEEAFWDIVPFPKNIKERVHDNLHQDLSPYLYKDNLVYHIPHEGKPMGKRPGSEHQRWGKKMKLSSVPYHVETSALTRTRHCGTYAGERPTNKSKFHIYRNVLVARDKEFSTFPIIKLTGKSDEENNRFYRTENKVLITGVKFDFWIRPHEGGDSVAANWRKEPWAIRMALVVVEGGLQPNPEDWFEMCVPSAPTDEQINATNFRSDYGHWPYGAKLNRRNKRVLWDKTFKIGMWNDDPNTWGLNLFRHGQKYIPIKREFTFANDTTDTPTENIYVVTWMWRVGSSSAPQAIPATPTSNRPWEINYSLKTYFRKAPSLRS